MEKNDSALQPQLDAVDKIAPVMTWGAGADNIRFFFNPAWLAFTGRTIQEESGNGWMQGLHPDDLQRCRDLMTLAFNTEMEFKVEYRLRGNDGSYRWLLDKGIPEYTNDGRFAGYIGACTDVDEILELDSVKERYGSKQALLAEHPPDRQLVASNEALASANKELLRSLESLRNSNAALELRIAARIAELSESEERFRKMAEESDILIGVSDESGDAVYFSKAWTELTGRSMDDLLKFGWADLIHPDDKVRYVNTYLNALRKKEAFSGEFRALDREGQYRWFFSKCPPRFRPDGTFAGYISSCIDITDRKHWEADLSASAEELQATNEKLSASNEELAAANEELLEIQTQLQEETVEKQKAIDRLKANEENIRNMVRQAPVGMCIVQGDPLYVVEVNASFLQLIGKNREELQARPYWEVIAEAAALYEPITDEVLRTGVTYHAKEHKIPLIRNGVPETVHVDFVFEPMRDGDGRPYAIMIIALDITDKVVARKKVERAEETLRMAIDAAEMGSYYINTTDRIFHASPRLKEFFGFAPDEEVPYEAAINQIHEDYRQAAADLVEAAITKGVRFDMEYPVVGYHDGRIRWVRGIGEVQHDSDGKSYFTGVLHEITERKLDEIRKNDFIGMVSHELKTPLTSLTAIVQFLNEQFRESEDEILRVVLSRANIQVKKMKNMINGFLNVSRLESGKIIILPQEFDLEILVKEMIEEMAVIVTDHTFYFSRSCPAMVNADRDKIGSVISNFLNNAVKYSPHDSMIRITCKAENGQATVSVKDEGIGIKPRDLERIFDRYYRVESNNTQHISGFGIGLYLSAEIIKAHNGRIWTESEIGKGSTFYFSLPLSGQ
jgi:PAS domain S-box-containing protein